jgi:hypothetical protein
MTMIHFLKSSLLGMAVAGGAMAFSAGLASAACSSDALALIKNLDGSWRGSGTVQPIGGAKERISCRVDYKANGARVSQKISCAGTDYKFDAGANVACEGTALSGTWEEKVANNTGSVSGDIQGKRLNIQVDGPNFKGRFAVSVDSRSKHSLTITQFDPGAGRHVPVATVALSR